MKALRPELLLLLLLLFLVHFTALFTFTKGFITTRLELPHKSQCADFCDGQQEAAQHERSACWSTAPQHPHRIRKVVLMIIDALRADFYYEPESNSSAAATIIRGYSLHMPRLRTVLHEAGTSAFVAPFIADTPTITMSRLKTLLTGSLPTFLDVGSSFSAASLTEDNLLDQLKKKGKRMIFSGDDTWMQLAPLGTFDAAHPYPSFNVHDLHTVDNGVWQYLNHYLAHPKSWDFLVGHYLGLDHAGHSRGVASPGMAQKLAQMDAEVDEIARKLHAEAYPGGPHEHTLLLVLGDHGQTLGGDHGGSSKEETDSLIAAINVGKWRRQGQRQPWQQQHSRNSPSPNSEQSQQKQKQPAQPDPSSDDAHQNLQQQQQQQPTKPDPDPDDEQHKHLHLQQQQQQQQQQQGTTGIWTLPHEHLRPEPPQASDVLRPQMRDVAHVMTQLDFTSTLALLLGLPIPYGNVGSVDEHMWAAAWEEGKGEHPSLAGVEGAAAPSGVEHSGGEVEDAAVPGDSAPARRQDAAAVRGCAVPPGNAATFEGVGFSGTEREGVGAGGCSANAPQDNAAAEGGCVGTKKGVVGEQECSAGAPQDTAAAEGGCVGTKEGVVGEQECSAGAPGGATAAEGGCAGIEKGEMGEEECGAEGGEAPFVLQEQSWRHSYLEALALTSQQVQRYLETYTQASSLTPRDLQMCSHLYKEAQVAYQAYLKEKQQRHELHGQQEGKGQQQQQQQQQQRAGKGQQQTLEQPETSLHPGRGDSEAEEETAYRPGHSAGRKTTEALYMDALAKLQASQKGAADLARAKFAGSSLPFMAFGCLLMLGSVALHVLVLARVCNSAMGGLPGPYGTLFPSYPILAAHLRTLCALFVSNPGSTCVPAGMVVFQVRFH
ncbi:alkaline-phosphatase-like protein [Dunaliella salina]|uniref:Alkaline-phosphatase-like protein n=1 Tax=Dunaliella salina TaxID=3046 RepID=A0ABQ7GK99_DUNSA|nr:alkaline-phosphatase-like protein [Dunaliella salina]|eukprot:KAF5835037.1 alkaline-phosphatase-like protein [Dunaliella salina]